MIGCSVEEEFIPPSVDVSKEVSFELNIPGHKIPNITRSVTYSESSVETLDVLLFGPVEQGVRKFKRHEKITGNITGTNNKISVRLKFLPEEAGCDVVFVTNARDIVSSINESDTKLTALEKLNMIRENKWSLQSMPIPMYGEITVKESDIKPGNKIDGINLTRMLARIDVKVDPGVYNFTLDQIYLLNRSTQGYIAPQWDSMGNINDGKVTQPNRSSDFTFANDQAMSNATLESDTNIQYGIDPDNNTCIGQIYTFESDGKAYNSNSEVATCLVIKGFIDNDLSKAHYYRVDITNDRGEFMPLLRNHQYNIEITAVKGIGYSTIKEALDAYTVVSNMHTRTIVWNNEMLSDINFNGQYMLGVQFEEMIFSSKGNSSNNFVATDYGKGITIVEKPDWVTITDFSDGQTEAFVKISVGANPDFVIRSGEIKLQAGRVTHSILVKQNPKSDRANSIVNIATVKGIGYLGNQSGGEINTSIGMRKVLDKHFKMGGTVELKQINHYAITNNPMVTVDYLNDKDIIFLTYDAIPWNATVNLIIEWLEASPNRVLVVSFDSSGTNPEVFKLDYFKQDMPSIMWQPQHGGGGGTSNSLVHTPGAEYFWKDGPFTNGKKIENATYVHQDGIFGSGTVSPTSKVLPIFEYKGGMVFGVNMERRIVYIGDSQYGEHLTGSTYTNHRFNNKEGNVTNDIEKIFSNIWAWIIDEVVLKEE